MNKALSRDLKQKLIARSLQKNSVRTDALGGVPATPTPAPDRQVGVASGPDKRQWLDFSSHPDYRKHVALKGLADQMGVENPFFRVHEARAGALTQIEGQSYINYSSYNYLGLCGHKRVNQAAVDAVAQYGTSASASRIVSGERPLHRQLEHALAAVYQADDALAFVSGHATNVTVIGYLMGPGDLILHDELIHNSALIGAELSGAKRLVFKHNDLSSLETLLALHRHRYERVLIVTEGLFSMDGDYPDLPGLIALKQHYQALLMVDEAHSLGVLGARGYGLAEYYGIAPDQVDIWMGTLSKTLAACGGYIAGDHTLIELLRNLAPGFLYSVGLAPQVAAPALAALHVMQQEPERVARLQHNSHYFLQRAQQFGLDTGSATGYGVIPVLIGGSLQAVRLSQALFAEGINVQPVIYPAVPESQARLRFFICSEHTEQQIDDTLAALLKHL